MEFRVRSELSKVRTEPNRTSNRFPTLIDILCKIKEREFDATIAVKLIDYYEQKDIKEELSSMNHPQNVLDGYKTDHFKLNILYQIFSVYEFQLILLEHYYDYYGDDFFSSVNKNTLKCYSFIVNKNYFTTKKNIKKICIYYRRFIKHYVKSAKLFIKNSTTPILYKEKLNKLKLNVCYYT